jgi:magnesium chelatase subunit D
VFDDGRVRKGEMGGAEALDALALRYGLDSARLDGWAMAEKVSEVGLELADGALKAQAVRLASHAVIRRACRLVGPMRISKRRRFSVMTEPFRGELDAERTLENVSGKEEPEAEDWIVSTREEHERAVCLMMDVSLSMSGRNLALAALTTAVLALKIPEGDLAVVAFDSMARVITHLGQVRRADEVVEGILRLPARGYTNLEDALATGCRELKRVTHARRTGLLITDGVYTVGGDPTPWASQFPKLHVLMTQDYKVNEELCLKLARLGRGELFRVERFEDMPARMLELANRI